ncbi:MAG: hypothetical protein RJB62_2020, partial [Pseudomonadota bacterium]
DVANLPSVNVRSYGYAAHDGSQITGMLFTPPETTEPLPAIVLPPGLSGFEEGNFNWLAQYFAQRGYAVLHSGARQIRSFGEVSGMDELGNWVRQVHEDIGSGIDALAAEGIVDPDRVCVLGYGFDGYIATIGVAVAQERYACIVSLFGIADLEDYIWEMRYSYYGFSVFNNDVIRYRRDYDEAELRRYSPHTYVDAFNVPVMFTEERYASTQSKTEDLADAMRRAGKFVTYLEMRQDVDVFSAERRNIILREVGAFLDEHIGG